MVTESNITPGQSLIFLGPSLSWFEAKKHLPTAFYLPPARCGDILLALRLKPAFIGIIDGFFEHTAAVWHKEILYALEQGVTIAGASSMGALRAAELSTFGMVGVGKIYTDYYNGSIIDDDEVAVLHQDAEHHYTTVTDAMVNIRATLISAIDENIIPAQTAHRIIQTAKKLNYRARTLEKAIQLSHLETKELANLNFWLESGGYIDQKKIDAITLLDYKQQGKIQPLSKPITSQRSIFLRSLYHQMMSSPFSSEQPWLPTTEKVIFAAQQLEEYPQLQRLARLLELSYQIAQTADLQSVTCLDNAPLPIKIDPKTTFWSKMHDATDAEKIAFLTRIAKINALLAEKMQQENIKTIPEKYLAMLLLTMADNSTDHGDSQNSKENPNPYIELTPLRYLATLWWLIEQKIEELGLQLTAEELQQASDEFRQQRKLLSKDAMNAWLISHSLDLSGYQQFITALGKLTLLLNNFTMLKVDYNTDGIFWLRDALWLTGYYLIAKDKYLPSLAKGVVE